MLTTLKNKNIFGFTLVELLVVISVIGVLMAVLVANFMGMRERARDTQKIQDLNAIRTTLRMYYNDNQNYPSSGKAVGVYCTSNDTDCLKLSVGSTYMPSINGIGYSYAIIDASGESFRLKSSLEVGAGDDDITSQLRCGVGVGETADKVYMVCSN